jgi:hypothetical protein
MQEQERAANEEAERRLKAALTAKREPASNTSRATSTNGTPNSTAEGVVEAKTTATEGNGTEDVNMEIDFVIPTPSSSQEASLRILDQVQRPEENYRVLGYPSCPHCFPISGRSYQKLFTMSLGK